MEYASSEHIALLNAEFLRQAKCLRQVKTSELPDRLLLGYALIQGVWADVEAVSLLFRNGFGNQAAMVVRALLEKIITILYLQIVEDGEFQAYIQYSAQKTYQITRRSVTIDGKDGPIEVRFNGNIDLSKSPEFKAAVDRFTSASGKPKTRWSNTSIDKKMDIVKASKIMDTGGIELLLLHIYDDGSEALHATLYGCLFHLGIFAPGKAFPRTKEEQAKEYSSYLVATLFVGIGMMHSFNEYIFGITKQADVLEECAESMAIVKKCMSQTVSKMLKAARTTPPR